jgi:hypothetical protein
VDGAGEKVRGGDGWNVSQCDLGGVFSSGGEELRDRSLVEDRSWAR